MRNGIPHNLGIKCFYLDMDGVLCNCTKALLAVHDRMDLLDNTPTNNLTTTLGLSIEDAWGPVVAAGWEFWEDIEPYPWMTELWTWAQDRGTVHILTSPTIHPVFEGKDTGYCVRGKIAWVQKHFGLQFNDITFTQHKHVVSAPGVILIDDTDDYEASFNQHGGRQIVFPQSYNRCWADKFDPMRSVEAQYRQLKRENHA